MSRPYRPSNGTEGDAFMHHFCYNCIHGKYEHTGDTNDNPCEIATAALCWDLKDKEYPKEWIYDDNNQTTCTAFVKHDWDRDDDGEWINPIIPEPDNPNQLCLPFIFDEMIYEKEVIKEEVGQTCPRRQFHESDAQNSGG